jgi:hypothetical protein
MLRRIDLRFRDVEMDKAYNAERRDYYTRILPYMSGVLLVYSLIFEIIYRTRGVEPESSKDAF